MTLKQVDSTNNYLKKILSNSKPVPEGTVIMAEEQFAGRGQRDNTWHAEPGKNLTFSVLFKPAFLSVNSQFDLTRAVSMGVFDALEPILGEKLKIKWPNDIYYGDNKLGGMLIENILQGSHIKNSVVGIGINVNQDNFNANAGNATSIRQILQKDYVLTQILSDICSNIEAYYLQLKAGKVDFVRNIYLSRLYWLNEEKLFRSNGEVVSGIIRNVTDTGLLVVQHQLKEAIYNLKEIEFLNK